MSSNSATAPTVAPADPAATTPSAAPDAARTAKRKLVLARLRPTKAVPPDQPRSAPGPAGGATAKEYTPPSTRLSDLGGVADAVEVLELVAMPLCHPEIHFHTGVHPLRGALPHGPPGCGKTLLANAIAGVRGLRRVWCALCRLYDTVGASGAVHRYFRSLSCIWDVRRI
jgi:ribosome biogenesis ATPase